MEEEKKVNEYRQGLISGILISISVALAVNCVVLTKKAFFTKELSGKDKAEYIHSLMEKVYIDDISEEDYYEGIFAGMVSVPTDRYSYYMGKEEFATFNQEMEGNYVGIGVYVKADIENEVIEVTGVFDGSPAKEVGLQKGDIILQVDELVSDFYNYEDIVKAVKGEEGTEVSIKIYRPTTEETLDFVVVRKAVDVPTVASVVFEDKIGYMYINSFDGVTAEQFKKVYSQLREQNIEGLIIDIRGNLGGMLTAVSEIADEIIPEGIITYTEDKNGKKEYVYATGEGIDIPLVVLTNESSASASELLAGCVKDTGVGKIVGKTTFGKGVVQTTYTLDDGSAVKLTTAKYYTPDGVCIHEKGVEPDYEIEAKEGFQLPLITGENIELDVENDLQLQKAIELLK